MTTIEENWQQVWNHFQLHATQRMSTFNFFIIISALVTTALVATYQKDFEFTIARYILSSSLIVVSIIFWKLDQRVQYFIHHAEEVLIEVETQMVNQATDYEYCPVFKLEAKSTNNKLARDKVWRGIFRENMSYSECFVVIYFLFGTIGTAGLIIPLF